MTKTAIIQIGNSDDKLSQKEWSCFVQEVRNVVANLGPGSIHFSGLSAADAPWQNACWVVEVFDSGLLPLFEDHLKAICTRWRQDSFAITVGETRFVSCIPPA